MPEITVGVGRGRKRANGDVWCVVMTGLDDMVTDHRVGATGVVEDAANITVNFRHAPRTVAE